MKLLKNETDGEIEEGLHKRSRRQNIRLAIFLGLNKILLVKGHIARKMCL